MNLGSLSGGTYGNKDGQEVSLHQGGDDHDGNEDEESPSGSDKKKEEDEVATVVLGSCLPATGSPPPTVKDEMQGMFLRLELSPMAAQKNSPWTLANLLDEDITAICDVIRMPDGLMGRRAPDREIQISILEAKNLKLAVFIFKSMENCPKL